MAEYHIQMTGWWVIINDHRVAVLKLDIGILYIIHFDELGEESGKKSQTKEGHVEQTGLQVFSLFQTDCH